MSKKTCWFSTYVAAYVDGIDIDLCLLGRGRAPARVRGRASAADSATFRHPRLSEGRRPFRHPRPTGAPPPAPSSSAKRACERKPGDPVRGHYRKSTLRRLRQAHPWIPDRLCCAPPFEDDVQSRTRSCSKGRLLTCPHPTKKLRGALWAKRSPARSRESGSVLSAQAARLIRRRRASRRASTNHQGRLDCRSP